MPLAAERGVRGGPGIVAVVDRCASEIRLVRTFDVADVRKRVDLLAREQRELDVEIQGANWTVDLAEQHD